MRGNRHENMTTYVSILRGINVGGHRMIKMDALRQLFAKLGFANSRTYIQSGNVVFQCGKTNPQELENKIADAIADTFGFAVPVILKELEEFKRIVENNPFAGDNTKDASHLHITFLSGQPDPEKFHKIKEGHCQAHEFHLIGQSIYLYCPNGYSKSKLTNGFLENNLGVTTTTRNWKTANELITLAGQVANA